jgi:quinol monooxygenase YgiN
VEFVVIAQYRARAGEADRVEEALRKMVPPTGAFDAHRATPHFATWLAGVVLPSLDSRIRLDLVPLAG